VFLDRRRRRRWTTGTTTGWDGERDENETGAIERRRAELLRLSVSAMTAAAAAAETRPEKVNDKEKKNQIKTVKPFSTFD